MATVVDANESSTSAEWSMNKELEEADPEVFSIIQKEKTRQLKGLEMIASENFTSRAVLQCLSSCLHNKYSEGQPGVRYVTCVATFVYVRVCHVIYM